MSNPLLYNGENLSGTHLERGKIRSAGRMPPLLLSYFLAAAAEGVTPSLFLPLVSRLVKASSLLFSLLLLPTASPSSSFNGTSSSTTSAHLRSPLSSPPVHPLHKRRCPQPKTTAANRRIRDPDSRPRGRRTTTKRNFFFSSDLCRAKNEAVIP